MNSRTTPDWLGSSSLLRTLSELAPTSKLGALIRLPLRLIPRDQEVRVCTGLNKGKKWIVGSGTHGNWLGTYEHDKQALLSKVVRPGMVTWDVGANVGFYTLALATLAGSAGRVFAFEPLAENVAYLLKHVHINGIASATVIQAALSDTTGLAAFQKAASSSMGHLSDAPGNYLVPTFGADDFIARIPESRPDLIKVDIEGAEVAFLKGAFALLERSGPALLLSLHGDVERRDCQEILRTRGYSLFHIDGSAVVGPLEADEVYAHK